MKYLLIILLTLAAFASKAQQRFPTGTPTQFSTGYFKQGYHQSDSGTIIANRDTNWLAKYSGTVVFKPSNKKFYWFDSTNLTWNLFGSTIDTISLSNRINLKLNISDTAAMLLPYLRKADTTNKWVQDVYVRNDSLFKFKNGAETFLDTLGGGGGGAGTVTSVALSMPSAFSVTGSPITGAGTFAVSGAGTSLQYMRGNGTLATTDTGMIPDFHLKVRSLLTGTSPITFNQTTGAIGINNANATGTKGAASFTGAFSDNGSGLIDLLDLVTAGSCINCNITFDAKGRATAFTNGTGPSGSAVDTIFRTPGVDSTYFTINSTQYAIKDSTGASVTLNNLGTGFRWLATPSGDFKTVFGSNTILIDSSSNANGLTFKADTSVLATQFDLTQIVSGINQLTGDVTAGPGTGSQVATIANNAVTDAKFRQSAALSVVGNSTNSTANVADIAAASDNQILRRSGTAIGFGSINLASSNAVGSSILPVANGGTGTATPSLVAGTNISITGTWPNQTINASGGGSVNAGIQTTLNGDTLNYDPRINSNLVFNDFLLTTIGPGWNATNAPNTTITFSDGHMRLVGGNASDYIIDSTTTIVHRWTEEVGAVIQSVGGSDYFAFGIQSQGIQTIYFRIKASDLSSTVSYTDVGVTVLGTTPAQGTTSIGDSVIYRIRRDNYILYFDVVNVTQSTSQTLVYNYADIDAVAGTVNPFRTFSITLNPVAGTIDIDYVKLFNQERLYADWLIAGMSITDGFNAGPPDSTYYNRLQSYFPDKRFSLYAISGSQVIDFIGATSLKNDMLALRPKRAMIMLGINDIQASVPTQTFIDRTRALVDTLENHYVQVVVCNTTPYNAANRAAIIAYNSALLTEFGPQLINIYDTLEVDGLMKESTDSLHPDAPGHRYMFNVMKDYITSLANMPYNPEGIIRIFPRGIEASTTNFGGQSNFGIIPLNIGGSGTTSPGISYNVKFQPDNTYKYRETDFANLLQLGNSGKFSFKLAPSGTAGNALTWTEVATIATDGNVGIGETTPLAALHIKRNQSGKTTLGEASMLILDNTSGGVDQRQEIGMGYRNGNAYSPIVLGNVVISNTDFTISDFYIGTRALTTNTAPLERFRITYEGKAGINTSAPVWGLDVQRTVGANKDSITIIPSIGSNSVLVIDTTNGKFQRIAASAFSSGITTLNTLTASTQTFATGTTGTDFNISSATSTHTFNIPSASTSNRGLVTVSSQTFGGVKTFNDGIIATSSTFGNPRVYINGNIATAQSPGINGVNLGVAAMTFTDNAGAGSEGTGQHMNTIFAPTITSPNARSYTSETSTLFLGGAPIAAGSITLDHPYNIYANDVNYIAAIATGLNEQAGNATLGNASFNVYTGTGGDTFTLPALVTHPGKIYFIKNAGSGNLTVSRAGSDNLYQTSSVTTITVAAGADVIIIAGSSFWYVQN